MKKTEININDVGTFPKFAQAAIRILLEMLKCMMNRKEPPVVSVNGQAIYQPTHITKIFGFSERKERQIRSDDEIEYMIGPDCRSIIYLESHVQDFIDRNYCSSRSAEGQKRRQTRQQRFVTTDTKSGIRK